jgi:DNA topoisomerase-3
VDQFWRAENFTPEQFWTIDVSLDRGNDPNSEDGNPKRGVQFTWARGHLFEQIFCFILYERCVENPLATVVETSGKPKNKW